jgi:hypothetical protein
MKHIKRFSTFEGISVPDSKISNVQRTKQLSNEEFLKIINESCKNFSFKNDLLWRNKIKKYDLELFTPDYRNVIPLAFPNFFNKIEGDPDYPVIRKKSLIGGTNKDIIKKLVGFDNYLVIPFDGSEIVFAPIADLWAMDDNRQQKSELVNEEPVSDKHFVKVSYTSGFKIPSNELELLRSKYKLKGGSKHGYEFFTSSPCLLVHESKVDWLKNNL